MRERREEREEEVKFKVIHEQWWGSAVRYLDASISISYLYHISMEMDDVSILIATNPNLSAPFIHCVASGYPFVTPRCHIPHLLDYILAAVYMSHDLNRCSGIS